MFKETSLVENWLIESKREGREEGQRSLLQNLLAIKFGALSPETKERLSMLGVERLNARSQMLITLNNEES